MAGQGWYYEDTLLYPERRDHAKHKRSEAYLTVSPILSLWRSWCQTLKLQWSYIPVYDSGVVAGVMHPIFEVTEKVVGARRIRAMRDLSVQLSNVRTFSDLWKVVCAVIADLEADLPYGSVYSFKYGDSHSGTFSFL
jgi:hypothetical protein